MRHIFTATRGLLAAAWMATYVLTAPAMGQSADGDFNRSGEVEVADYTIWANNFGMMVTGPESGPQAVPEPSTLALLLIAAVGLIAARLRSRH